MISDKRASTLLFYVYIIIIVIDRSLNNNNVICYCRVLLELQWSRMVLSPEGVVSYLIGKQELLHYIIGFLCDAKYVMLYIPYKKYFLFFR